MKRNAVMAFLAAAGAVIMMSSTADAGPLTLADSGVAKAPARKVDAAPKYGSVVSQQGRVAVDADFNEARDIPPKKVGVEVVEGKRGSGKTAAPTSTSARKPSRDLDPQKKKSRDAPR